MLANKSSGQFLFKEGRAIGPAIENKISAFYKEMMETSEITFALAMQMGLIRTQHPQVAAMIIIGGISQIFYHWLEGDIEDEIDVLTEQSVSFFNHALGVT
jgi:hypothetical protein